MSNRRWTKFLWPSQNIWTLLVVLCCSWWSWIHELPWPLKINFSSVRQNLIKTFHNKANNLITKNCIEFFFGHFWSNLEKSNLAKFKVNFLCQDYLNLSDFFIETYKFRRSISVNAVFWCITSISKNWFRKLCCQIV